MGDSECKQASSQQASVTLDDKKVKETLRNEGNWKCN